MEGRYGTDEYHIVILDRGLFDALAWFELLKEKDDITSEDCSAIQKFLLVGHWRTLVDTVFLFQTDPATSLERENRKKLIEEPGRAMNPDFLSDLNAAYNTTRQKYAEMFNRFCAIDTGTGQSTELSTAHTVADSILEQLSQPQAD